MSFVAARSGRVRLAPNVLSLPLRPPAVLARAVASLDILSGFKAAVDELRRFLWFYIDELAKRAGTDPDLMIQGYRLRRATEMLRVLSDEPMIAACPTLQDTQSFLEQVITVVEDRLTKVKGA